MSIPAPTTTPPTVRNCRGRDPGEREQFAAALYAQMSPMLGALGLLFVGVVLAQTAATPGSTLQRGLTVVTWLLWAVFVAEYVLRLVIAPHTGRFLRQTWWQLAFLVIPVLSILRIFAVLRVARPTRVLLAAIRGSRSAANRLTSRTTWLAVVTLIVVFASATVVFERGAIEPYGAALHASAMATIAGETIPADDGLVQVLNVLLAVYSVVGFAALAGILGAYFLERREEDQADARKASSNAS